mmetsp:Transcript_47643/g.134232  ORF Transcript_47643/g.134232 Transcript_47643/m.134232 type:complete len:192 (+) Transcript_47643:118-693(+)
MFSASRLATSSTGRIISERLAATCCTGTDQWIRSKHSSTQIKRLFKRNPAKFRVAKREGWIPEPKPVPPPTYSAIFEPTILPNGWSAPPGPEIEVPSYPFQVRRTRNKPSDALGFLPVYSEFRKDGAKVTTRIKKVSGNADAFLSELRSVLQIPVPANPNDDTIRIRTGGTIEVKGNRVREVKHWLASLGF